LVTALERFGNTVPVETYPDNEGTSGGDMIVEYFASNYNFNAEEATTIMGAHTLGSGDPEISGYVGPWAPVPNHLMNAYFGNMQLTSGGAPPGLDCETDANNPSFTGRCNGWELQRIDSTEFVRFQWQLFCTDDGNGCVGLMLHADVGLFWDLDAYICTPDDVQFGIRGCEFVGEIREFPPNSPCGEWAPDKRIFIKCFEERPTRDYAKETVVEYSQDNPSFMMKFGDVFDRMITERLPDGHPGLQTVDPFCSQFYVD
jgi:hypothetical protein